MTWEVELIIFGLLVIIGLDVMLIWLHAVNKELLNTVKKYQAFLSEEKRFSTEASNTLKDITSETGKAMLMLIDMRELYDDMINLTHLQHAIMVEIHDREKDLGNNVGMDVGSINVDNLKSKVEEINEDEKN